MKEPRKAFAGILVLTLLLGVATMTIFTSDVDHEHSVSWCEEQGGNVSVSNVIGGHGGFHCELPNGTIQHVYLADNRTGVSS